MTTFIRLLHDYGGADTRDRRILPGIYEMGDPRLFGIAQTLLEDGHAVAVEEVPSADETVVQVQPDITNEALIETFAVTDAGFAVVEIPPVEVESVEGIEEETENEPTEGEQVSGFVEDEQPPADEEKPSKHKSKHA